MVFDGGGKRCAPTNINKSSSVLCVSFLNWFQIELNHRLASYTLSNAFCTKPSRSPPFSNFILCLSALLPQNWTDIIYNYIIAFALPGLYRYFREYLYVHYRSGINVKGRGFLNSSKFPVSVFQHVIIVKSLNGIKSSTKKLFWRIFSKFCFILLIKSL